MSDKIENIALGHNIEFALVTGTALALILVIAVVISLLSHKASQRRHKREVEEKENQYRQEILCAELEGKEQTLRAISEEIHDNIGQMLSLVKLNLNTLPKDPEKSAKKLDVTRGQVKQLSEDLRHLSRLLHPDHRDMSLADVLRTELEKLEETGAYKVSFMECGIERNLPSSVHVLVYRMIQELLNNIIKHAQANKIDVWLEATEEFTKVSIQDNGIGCHPDLLNNNGESSGMGIRNLHYRASLIGATLHYESEKNIGTNVNLVLHF